MPELEKALQVLLGYVCPAPWPFVSLVPIADPNGAAMDWTD